MGIIFGSARIDENGNIAGGAAGDQTGSEVSTQSYYMHSKGWYCLRPKDATVASKIATAMKQACNNNHIGYDQNQRNTCWSKLKKYGTLGAIAENCETDCSALVRCCIYQASGRDVGDMYTGNLASNLENSGLFNSRFSVSSEAQLYNGDVLVTKSTGHTVVVVSGRARGTSSGGSTSSNWKATGTATSTDDDVNVRSAPDGTIIGKLNKGNRFEVDGTQTSGWIHVKVAGIGIGYVYKDYVKYDGATSSTTSSGWKATGTATCTDNNVNVRKTAGGTVLGQLNKGNRFEVDGKKSGDWVHIKVRLGGSDKIAYIHKDYVKYD